MKTTLIGILILLIGVAAGWYALDGQVPTLDGLDITGTINEEGASTEEPTGTVAGLGSTRTPEQESEENGGKGGVAGRTVVLYTESGFSPTEAVVQVGTTVAFMNDSDARMRIVARSQNDQYSELQQSSSVSRGGSYEYTFDQVGRFEFRNDDNASHTGVIVVE